MEVDKAVRGVGGKAVEGGSLAAGAYRQVRVRAACQSSGLEGLATKHRGEGGEMEVGKGKVRTASSDTKTSM